MGDLPEKRIGGDLAEEDQSWSKKPATVFKPLPLRASANVPLGAGSSFRPWTKPSAGSNSVTKPPMSAPAAEIENRLNMEKNLTPTSEVVKLINSGAGGSATSGYANADITAKSGGGQGEQPEMDAKLKRILSNRLSAQKFRMKKNAHVIDLEHNAQAMKAHIALLHQEIAEREKEKQYLQIEQHQLKLRMAAHEKLRILCEAAIERNKAEVERLRKLEGGGLLNLGASVQPFNLNHSNFGFGQFALPNNYFGSQGRNGGEASQIQVGTTVQQSQNQSQLMMRITNYDNKVRATPNLYNKGKFDPAS